MYEIYGKHATSAAFGFLISLLMPLFWLGRKIESAFEIILKVKTPEHFEETANEAEFFESVLRIDYKCQKTSNCVGDRQLVKVRVRNHWLA